jgi:hypothetical protein
MRRALLFSWLMMACGSSAPAIFGGDDVAAIDASFDHTLTDSLFNSDAVSTFDASLAPDAPKFGGGGPFLCNGCICDGTLNLCEHVGGGPAPMPLSSDAGDAGDFGDASACDFDAGNVACAPIPVECLPNPSCACLMTKFSGPCTCDIDPSGNGLVVMCNYP